MRVVEAFTGTGRYLLSFCRVCVETVRIVQYNITQTNNKARSCEETSRYSTVRASHLPGRRNTDQYARDCTLQYCT